MKSKLIVIVVLFVAGVAAAFMLVSKDVSVATEYNSALASARENAEKDIPYMAVYYYEKALKIKNNDEAVYKEYLAQSEKLGDDFYTPAMEKYVSSFPDSPEAYELMCTYYYGDDNYNQVIKYANEAREKGVATDAVRQMYLGCVYKYRYINTGFDEVNPFLGDFAVVKKGSYYGYVRSTGDFLISPMYDKAVPFLGTSAAVCVDDEWYMINQGGYKIAVPEGKVDYMSMLSNGRVLIGRGGKFDYTDVSLKIPEELRFDSATVFKNNIAAVKTGGKWALLKSDGNFATDYIFEDIIIDSFNTCIANGVIFAKQNGKYYMYNNEGAKISDAAFDDAKPFIDGGGEAAVCVNKKWGFADATGAVTIEPKYDEANSFCCGLAPVKKNGSWGYIGNSEEFRIDPIFEDCLPFSANGITAVSENGVWNYIRLLSYID